MFILILIIKNINKQIIINSMKEILDGNEFDFVICTIVRFPVIYTIFVVMNTITITHPGGWVKCRRIL